MTIEKVAFKTHNDPDLIELAQIIMTGYGLITYSGGKRLGPHKALYIETSNKFGRFGWIGHNSQYIDDNDLTLIDLEPFKAMFRKGETIELNGNQYLKSDLEEAVKHLKPIRSE